MKPASRESPRHPSWASAPSECLRNPRHLPNSMACPTPVMCRRHTTYAQRTTCSGPHPGRVVFSCSSLAPFTDRTVSPLSSPSSV
eukprot:6212866-Pleurochrysis_carterae.AAC.5